MPATQGRSRAKVEERRSWREVGWIFRDGEIIAIERRGTETRSRRVEPDQPPDLGN
jgi:hypothetical protein